MRYWAFPSKVSDRLAVIQGNRNLGAAELAREVLISKPKYSRRSFCPTHPVLKTVEKFNNNKKRFLAAISFYHQTQL